ncbi:MAG: GntR family transcriptional regulator [Faecalibacterium sp.]|nr:GntR family transcriptional regulator [Faecalibacterium sp.]
MLLRLDFGSDIPIYQQIRNQIVLGIGQGQLAPGQKLPAIRALADECGVNTMTVSKAYQLLKAEGYLRTDRRGGTVICRPQTEAQPRPETLQGLRLHLNELKLVGYSEQQILQLCRELCRKEG